MLTAEEYRENVRHPGKFEGCSAYVPYFWDLLMDGDGEELDDNVVQFVVTNEDIAKFRNELGYMCGHKIKLWEDDQGFVHEL